MDPDLQRLEDISSIRDAMRQISQEASVAVDLLDAKREVKSILGVSYGVIYALINDGRLRCWKVTGQPVSRHDVGESTWGLRFRPSDVREFLEEQLVK